MKNKINPFLVSGYAGPQYFCDRKQESLQLTNNIKNNRHTTLFSIRRMGKSGLIHHVFHQFKNSRSTAGIYVDILPTGNLKDFTNQLATVIYNRFPENKGIGKKLAGLLRLLRPIISYDQLTGTPQLSFELKHAKEYEKTIQQLLRFLDRQPIKIVLAIDEFQQILEYPEKNTEAILRTQMQTLRNTHFIFCGSNQKMMHHIFNNASRPFYASCSNVHLDLIGYNEYAQFIKKAFQKVNRTISEESIEFILEWTLRHTFYTQYFCNFLYASGIKRVGIKDIHQTATEILKLNEPTYYQYRNLMTEAQWNLLLAIAMETKVSKPHSKDFIHSYKLGSSSMVTRGIGSLMEKEMIFYNTGVPTPYYEVYDKFLMRWLQNS